MTFAEEIENEAGGPIIAIVIAAERGDSWGAFAAATLVDCHAITAWTEDKVIVVAEYDGATGLLSIPRNPAPVAPVFALPVIERTPLRRIAPGEYDNAALGLYVRRVTVGAGLVTAAGGHTARHVEWEATRRDTVAAFATLGDVRDFFAGLRPISAVTETP